MKIEIKRYQIKNKKEWDELIPRTFNGTFLHKRDYMDYHRDRFEDFSLLIYYKNKLAGLLPAHKKETELISHNGLTYGDLLLESSLKSEAIIGILHHLLQFIADNGFINFRIKTVPVFFHSLPNEILNYYYYKFGAVPEKIHAYFLLDKYSFRLNQNRKRSIKKMPIDELSISIEIEYLPDFWEILSVNLENKYRTSPVHTLEEMSHLAKLFPENIRLYTLWKNEEILSGVLVYLVNHTLHFQYISAGRDKKNRNGIDYLTKKIIEDNVDKYDYISLGSAENPDGSPHQSLIYWKESFGAKIRNQLYFRFKFEE